MKSSKSQKTIYIIISILVAIVFWLYVDNTSSDEQELRLYNVPVTFVGETEELADRGLMLLSGSDTAIDLRLQGRRSVISKINKNNIIVQVDVSNIYKTGTQSLDYEIIYPSSVSSSSVTLVSASMYKISVVIGELHSKTIQILTDVNGTVPDGYMLRECIVSPQTLTISGTEEDVNAVDHALASVTLSGQTASYSEYLNYSLIDTMGNVVNPSQLRCSEDKVRVDVPIVTLKEVPLSFDFIESGGSTLDDLTYRLSIDSITLSGEETTLNHLETIEVSEIDLSQILGDDTLEYEIPIPSGCTNESGVDTVKVTIKWNDLKTETFECTNISFTNVTEGYTPTAVTQSVNVTLRGKQAELDKVNAKNIRLVVDLLEISSASGTYTTKAKVYVDGTADVGAIGTYQISYRLQKS